MRPAASSCLACIASIGDRYGSALASWNTKSTIVVVPPAAAANEYSWVSLVAPRNGML